MSDFRGGAAPSGSPGKGVTPLQSHYRKTMLRIVLRRRGCRGVIPCRVPRAEPLAGRGAEPHTNYPPFHPLRAVFQRQSKCSSRLQASYRATPITLMARMPAYISIMSPRPQASMIR